MNLETARQQMIGQQLRAWDVLDDRVLAVMARIPRESFVAPGWQALAYADIAVPVGAGRRLPPPKLQGRALQALGPRQHETVLEVGCGSGYLSACLARLAAQVIAVEWRPELAAAARRNLATLGIDNVTVLEGDGLALEFPGRFDVVCVNGSLPAPRPELERLLEVGGRLFVVVGHPPVMTARRVTRTGESEWLRENLFETCLPALEQAQSATEFVF